MDHLRHKYLEEARDLLQELEQALLILEEKPDDNGTAETIFRVMHTLKGSSSMFGFQKVGDLTHLLENCFENVREGKAKVGRELITLTFSALDHIQHLLQDPELSDKKAAELHNSLLKQAIELYDETIQPGEGSFATDGEKEEKTFFIYFEPRKEILKNGANPLYILDDLAQLGNVRTFVCVRDMPSLEEVNPQLCYLSWGVLLTSLASISEIQDVFLFVDHLCELEIQEITKGNAVEKLGEEALQKVSDRFQKRGSREIIQELKDELRSVSEPELSEQDEPSEVTERDSLKESKSSSIRVASDKLDDLMNLISELVANQERLSLLAGISTMPELAAVSEEIEKITRQLRDKTFDICLVPIGSLITRFKRLVRDLSLELKKSIAFEAEGLETELDKNVVDSLSECLIHIFRNSIDHGLEEESERIRKGKSAQGKITLKAFNSGTNVVIEVQDDGAGINLEKVRNKALEKGLIRQDQKLNEQEIMELLFMPGFSTAQGVTAVSGRGVGMDVVRKKIKELRGDVRINSLKDTGTTITIALPLTISILDGLLVRVSDTDFVLPLSFVEKSYAVSSAELGKAINNQLILDGKPVIFFNLADAFAFGTLSQTAFGVVIKMGNNKVVLLVDEIIGEYQAVLKPLGRFYQDQDFLSGGSLKGDGTVALVIDPQKLINDIIQKTALEI